ncbi:MAG TPA: MASE1 domain-containing protein [Gemmatimonadaceae bacterium]|nr:MASE1 domain-containing protein [Gemmatimonadaceae bacterium]
MTAPVSTTEQRPEISFQRALFSPAYFGQVAIVAILYVLAALGGLRFDAVSGFASLVWAPTGIALAVVLLAGRRIWPGIFIGALVTNVITGAPVLAAAGIGVGNTLEAVIGAYALRRVPGFRLRLDSMRDVLTLIVIGALLATMISAMIGVATLHFAGLAARQNLAETWRTWWIGDAIGALLVAPLILVWAATPRARLSARRVAEAVALIVGLVGACVFVFIVSVSRGGGPLGQGYVFFPLLMWAAIRFNQRGAVTATAIVSAIAIAGTVMGRGPFIQPTLHDSLLALQTFMGITGATFLVLGASISERERSREQLREAHRIATAANRAKAEFLAVMSHELRTPLNAIAGYAELLALGVPGPLTPKQTDAINRIQSNQEHLLALIDDVLSFARIEAGTNPIAIGPVGVGKAVDSLAASVRPNLERQGLSYIWNGCDSALVVRADRVKLRQILLNVLGNAIKFTPRQGRIELSVARSADRVSIRVSDTGVGIPPEMTDHVFEPFFQVQRGTTREYPGVGLGLAISRDFARAMGGDITVESVLGKGTIVTVELPAA